MHNFIIITYLRVTLWIATLWSRFATHTQVEWFLVLSQR